MARPRKPTAIHVLKGTAEKHPDRMRERGNEPQPTGGIGPCPTRLGPQVAEAWDSLVDGCAPGVLTSMDRVALQLAATLLARFWADPMECDVKIVGRLHSLLGSMGMTPADRSKVVVPKSAKAENPFKAMLGGRSGTSTTS